MGAVLTWLFLAVILSCAWDVFTYERRQDAWEAAHPGKQYIRNYRKLTRQQERQGHGTDSDS